MKKNIILVFVIAACFMNCYSQEKNDTLVKLVSAANEEMKISSEELNKWIKGETLESVMKKFDRETGKVSYRKIYDEILGETT